MYIVEVIPIARGITKDSLSYFTAMPIEQGSLVSVPLRKKFVSAIVISSKSARDEKSGIKAEKHQLRKIEHLKTKEFLSAAFMDAASKTADYFAGSIGAVLNCLLPKAILEAKDSTFLNKSLELSPAQKFFERFAIQSDDEERFADYRSLIREEFAKKSSVFFCVPTAEDAKRASVVLAKGIEKYAYVLYGSLPKKKIIELWRKAVMEPHPILIIATGSFFSLNRGDIGTIIFENESSRFNKFAVRPFLNIKTFAEFFASSLGARFIAGDTLLSVETLSRRQNEEYNELTPLKFHSLSPAEYQIADMKLLKKKDGGRFETIGPELEKLLDKSVRQNEHLFIFALRRGFSGETVCGDCGTVVLCGRCHSPIALHRLVSGDGDQNYFFCHNCQEKRSAEERCKDCSSWKLEALGIGIERVNQELRQKFPHAKIFRVDKDSTPSYKAVLKTISQFYASPGSILLGTEMSLNYLSHKIENTAIASLDTLFSLPDFRVNEKILHLILKIRSFTGSRFIVQTRHASERILEYALKGNLTDFYRDEITARKRFGYPPFWTLIKISLAGNRKTVQLEMEKLKNLVAPISAEIFPAFNEERRGKFTLHALLKLPRGAWVDRTLLTKLFSLPPQFRIDVEPDSLL